jgi:hypothetical protein
MPLSINFNWRAPNVDVSFSERQRDRLNQGLMQAGNAISGLKDYRFRKEEQERRNSIEDADRQRRIDEEERQKKLYGEAAEAIRGKVAQRAALVQKRDALKAKIDALKARIGA